MLLRFAPDLVVTLRYDFEAMSWPRFGTLEQLHHSLRANKLGRPRIVLRASRDDFAHTISIRNPDVECSPELSLEPSYSTKSVTHTLASP